MVLTLGQFEVVLGDLERGLRFAKLLILRIKLDQKLIPVLGQRCQSVDLVLEALELLRLSGLLARVQISLLELAAQLGVLLVRLLKLLLRQLQVHLQRVALVVRHCELLVQFLDELVLDRG